MSETQEVSVPSEPTEETHTNDSLDVEATKQNFVVPAAPFRPKKGYGLLVPKVQKDDSDSDEEETKEGDKTIPLLYEPPFWSGKPKTQYRLELLKDGISKGDIDFCNKGFYLFGRAPVCDVILDHPSVSRQHAVIQFRRNGDAFLYDLASNHGTFLGKKRIKANSYIPIPKNNNLIKFGASSRLYILHTGYDTGENDDEDDEDDDEDNQEQNTEKTQPPKQPQQSQPKSKQQKQREAPPKIDRLKAKLDENDEDFAALTQHREFYKAMYKGDDDDAFFDRTGRVEKKRENQKKIARGGKQAETYETLIAKQKVTLAHKNLLQADIAELTKPKEKSDKQNLEVDPDDDTNADNDMLDSFMSDINSILVKEKLARKNKLLHELEREYDRISSLANLVKPALSGLADMTSFTEAQMKSVAQYEEDLKKRKQETDNDTRDRTAEKQKFVREKMKKNWENFTWITIILQSQQDYPTRSLSRSARYTRVRTNRGQYSDRKYRI